MINDSQQTVRCSRPRLKTRGALARVKCGELRASDNQWGGVREVMIWWYLHGGGVVQEGEGEPGERPTGHHVIWGHGYMPACLQRLALSAAQSTLLQHRLSTVAARPQSTVRLSTTVLK